MTMTVKATAEGLLGGVTASGYVIDRVVPFVALPSARALGKLVQIVNPVNGRSCYAFVLDVGPWNIDDDAYVFEGARPQSETGTDKSGRATNESGIDLGYKVWSLLGMKDNTTVTWSFVE